MVSDIPYDLPYNARVSEGNAETKECPECGTTNDTFVNPKRCWDCGHEW